jgi:hypothetical protein
MIPIIIRVIATGMAITIKTMAITGHGIAVGRNDIGKIGIIATTGLTAMTAITVITVTTGMAAIIGTDPFTGRRVMKNLTRV